MRKPKHKLAITLPLAIVIGGIIGVVDVLYVSSAWPMVAAQFLAAFCIVWAFPSRWISTGFTLTVMVWLAYAWVRVPWWPHPDEVDPQDFAAGLVALSAFGGALAAARIQVARGKL